MTLKSIKAAKINWAVTFYGLDDGSIRQHMRMMIISLDDAFFLVILNAYFGPMVKSDGTLGLDSTCG